MHAIVTCIRCDIPFEYEQKGYNKRSVCDTCQKVMIAKRQARYNATPKGKAASTRRNNSPSSRARRERYAKTPRGRESQESSRRNLADTPKSKARKARARAMRRKRSTNPKLYALRTLNLHILEEPCVQCGKAYINTYRMEHIVDHILALCNGGIDEWSNYQILCYGCHKKKTAEDNKLRLLKLRIERKGKQ